MKPSAKKIIRELSLLPKKEKKEVYKFMIFEETKDLGHQEKKIANFALKGTRKLREWNKKAMITLQKSKRFTNELAKLARA